MIYDWPAIVDDLNALLKLRSIPFGMKMFTRREDMEAIPKIRRPQSVHTLDQIVAQAARIGWTVGITSDDLVGAQCPRGCRPRWCQDRCLAIRPAHDRRLVLDAAGCAGASGSDALRAGRTIRCARRRPLSSGKLDPPDIALFYATPGAMIYFINGLQWSGYKRFDWSVVGESACADSWGRALTTRLPSLSIPCFAERRYGGVLDEEMLMATPPEYLISAIAGMKALSKNGFRYPFAQYGVQQDVRAGMAVSYPGRA